MATTAGRDLAYLQRVPFATASQWVDRLAEPPGRLQAELTRVTRYALLAVDEVGYIGFQPAAANPFFQLVSSRYERASLIVTPTRPSAAGVRFSVTTSSPPG